MGSPRFRFGLGTIVAAAIVVGACTDGNSDQSSKGGVTALQPADGTATETPPGGTTTATQPTDGAGPPADLTPCIGDPLVSRSGEDHRGGTPPEVATAPATPDGSSHKPRIVFSTDRDRGSEIVVADVALGETRFLTDNTHEDMDPAWSPDGTRVAFVSDRDGSHDLFVMDATGTDTVQLTDDDYRETGLAWSPDGTGIAYVRFSDADEPAVLNDYGDEDFDIFVTDVDGSTTRRVTHDDDRELAPVWSPDGTRIAYTRDTDPDHRRFNLEVVVVGFDGYGPVRLTGNGYGPVWSPDSSLVAYNSTRGIHVADADGGNARRFTNGNDPAWSPNGACIAFSSARRPPSIDALAAAIAGRGASASAGGVHIAYDDIEPPSRELFVASIDGTILTQLTDTRGIDESNPLWSPDGTRIAYRDWDEDGEIYVMDADGTNQRLIAEHGRNPAWSPDGAALIYALTPAPRFAVSEHESYVMDADGGNQLKLPGSGAHPAWSPDGDLIASSGEGEIVVVHADGTGFRVITDTFHDSNQNPVWSPDGTRIAHTYNTYPASGGSYSGEIWIMDADGGNRRQLTENQGENPVWSPDGKLIAYTTYGGLYDIFVIDPEGGDPVLLTPSDDQLVDACPEWSPDGTRIAYISLNLSATRDDYEIFVMDADGTNRVQLTDNSHYDGCPEWSPDGTRIAFTIEAGNSTGTDFQIFVMDADGTNPTLLNADGANPQWSSDGTQIAFVSDRDGDWEIFVMDADGTNEKQLTFNDDEDWGHRWSPGSTP